MSSTTTPWLVRELAAAIGAAASGDDEEVARIVGRVHEQLRGQRSLPGVPAPDPTPPAHHADTARRVFAYWQERCSHQQAKFTPDRARAIVARLRDGYTETELRKAVDGAAEAAFVSEETGQRYDDLTLICRNGSKLESFIARGVKATGPLVGTSPSGGTVEERITELRRSMSLMLRDGRSSEYEQASAELARLMKERKR